MFNHTLIAIDELNGGRDAVALARLLTDPRGTLSLTRVHAAYPTVSHRTTNSLQEAERRTAEVALRRAAAITGIDQLIAYGAASVGSGLDLLSVEIRADLIVAGSSLDVGEGHAGVGDSVTEALSRAGAPVAVAPRGFAARAGSLGRIGVAFEDSTEGGQALTLARHLAADHGAEVVVLEHVADAGEAGRAHVTEATRRLYGFSATVDLLVLGARGAGPLRRITHATAPLSLARDVLCPLVLATARTRMPRGTAVAATGEQWTSGVTSSFMRPL